MIEKYGYPKEPAPEGVKRDLSGIKKAVEWQENIYRENESIKNCVAINKYGKEASEIFDDAHALVVDFIKKMDIDIKGLDLENVKVFVRKSGGEEGSADASYDSFNDAIYINEEMLENKNSAKKLLMHEIFHSLCFDRFHMNQYKQEDNTYVNSQKSGFSSTNWMIEADPEFKHTARRKLFAAFNEGMTDVLTYVALPEDEKKGVGSTGYKSEVAMVSAIIAKVYPGPEFKKLIKSYFSGNVMHLRKIEKFYGKYSLDLLAQIETKDDYEFLYGDEPETLEKAYELRELAMKFFVTSDELRREEIKNLLQN